MRRAGRACGSWRWRGADKITPVAESDARHHASIRATSKFYCSSSESRGFDANAVIGGTVSALPDRKTVLFRSQASL
jgi:hypothetical protein